MKKAVVLILILSTTASAAPSPMIGTWRSTHTGGNCQYFPAYIKIGGEDDNHLGVDGHFDSPYVSWQHLVAPLPGPHDAKRLDFRYQHFVLTDAGTLAVAQTGPDGVDNCIFTRDETRTPDK